jgi:hypothetical protein
VTDEPPELEAVFIAASVREADFVERLLDGEKIEYEVRPEPFVRTPVSGVCAMGVLFEVLAGQADYCRGLIRDAGLERGIVSAEGGEGE